MKTWKTDDELIRLMKEVLFSAVIGDVMDGLGYYHQFLPPNIQPLANHMVVAGRAMPVLEEDTGDLGPQDMPFGLMLKALDDLKKNEVYLCTGASPTYALWGELMSVRAIKLGAAGAVVDGYSRDTQGILNLNFPTFSAGTFAQDQAPRGKVVDFRLPVAIGKVSIHPGDLVYGDRDGVCIVPASNEEEIILAALEKALGEKTVKKAIEDGMSASAAFEKYGIM